MISLYIMHFVHYTYEGVQLFVPKAILGLKVAKLNLYVQLYSYFIILLNKSSFTSSQLQNHV